MSRERPTVTAPSARAGPGTGSGRIRAAPRSDAPGPARASLGSDSLPGDTGVVPRARFGSGTTGTALARGAEGDRPGRAVAFHGRSRLSNRATSGASPDARTGPLPAFGHIVADGAHLAAAPARRGSGCRDGRFLRPEERKRSPSALDAACRRAFGDGCPRAAVPGLELPGPGAGRGAARMLPVRPGVTRPAARARRRPVGSCVLPGQIIVARRTARADRRSCAGAGFAPLAARRARGETAGAGPPGGARGGAARKRRRWPVRPRSDRALGRSSAHGRTAPGGPAEPGPKARAARRSAGWSPSTEPLWFGPPALAGGRWGVRI